MRAWRAIGAGAALVWAVSVVLSAQAPAAPEAAPGASLADDPVSLFTLSRNCMACHNGLTAANGQDVSIGVAWRGTIMANSARDPYWQASVRRETIDHPAAAGAIEDECAICHMPMARTVAHAAGREARVFEHLPVTDARDPESLLAHDGVSCTLCHQITPRNLGTRASFSGGFVIDTTTPPEQRPVYGPYPIEHGLQRIMHSVTGFVPGEGEHIRESAVCATCHSLYTTARGPNGEVVGELPEQVPFQEWRHSRYADERSCQSCHMPPVQGAAIASVLGMPRPALAQHTFLGGNAFMLRLLNRFRGELGVEALPQELDATAAATERLLAEQTATLHIEGARLEAGRVRFTLAVRNLTGHKFPTAYPSRRAWLHVTLRDAQGQVLFESGRPGAGGAIGGNDNDADPARFEPHYTQITEAGQVQIYESILGTPDGAVTTGLLQAVRYLKDNRLLPEGFDKASAAADIAVRGGAGDDGDFVGGGDSVEFDVAAGGATAGPVSIEVELLYQPIGFRWARNLAGYDAPEPRRFVSFVEQMQGVGSSVIARGRVDLR